MAGTVRIAILADAHDAVSGFAEVGNAAKTMGVKLGGVGSVLKGAFLAAGTAIAASGAVEGIKHIIDAGADLQAALGTNKQIFKENSAALIQWSEDAANTLGVSQAEALNATKSFGAFFTGIGMGTKAAADLSQEWAVMASNMAAFADLPTADALESIRAALRGELDPLQKYVPTISAATIQQKAMALTGKKNAEALTAADKALAINAFLHESVANKAGEAERKQGGYGVQVGRLKGQLTDMAAAIGSAVLPKLTDLAKWLNDKLIPAVKEFWQKHGPAIKDAFNKAGEAVGIIADKAKPVLDFMTNLAALQFTTTLDALSGVRDAVAGLATGDAGAKIRDSLSSVGDTLADIGKSPEATSIVDKVKQGFESLKEPVQKFADTVKPIIDEVAGFLSEKFAEYAPTIKATLSDIGDVFSQIFEGVKLIVQRVTTAIGFIWTNFGGQIKNVIGAVFGAVVAIFRGAFQIIKGIFDVILGVLTGDWSRAWDGVKGVVRGVVTIVKGAVNSMRAIIGLVMSVIAKALGAAWDWIKAKTTSAFNSVKSFFTGVWNGIVSFLSGVLGRVKSAISSAWSSVKNTTSSWWDTIKNAVKRGIDAVGNFVTGLPSTIKNVFLGAGTWLYDSGKAILQGLIDGMNNMVGSVVQKAKDVWSKVTGVFKGGGGGAKSAKDAGENAVSALAVGMARATKPLTKAGQSLYQFLQLGMIQGMTSSSGKLLSTVKALTSKITSAFPTQYRIVKRKGKRDQKVPIANPVQKRLLKSLDTANRTLKTKAADWDRTVAGIAAKTAQLNDYRKERADMLANVADTIKQSFTLVDQAAQDGDTSIRKILVRSGEAVAQARTFADQLVALRKSGLSPEVLQELAAAGPQAGAASARALMSATDQQVKELNENYKLIAASGQRAGDAVAGSFYDPLIAKSADAVKTLTAHRVLIEAQMRKLAMSLQSTISKAVVKYAVEKPKATGSKPKATPKKKPKTASVSAVPAAAGAQPPIYMTVNTGVVVDKRGLVDTVSAAINEVASAMGRPVKLAVEVA